jgi:hypothetical protein
MLLGLIGGLDDLEASNTLSTSTAFLRALKNGLILFIAGVPVGLFLNYRIHRSQEKSH